MGVKLRYEQNGRFYEKKVLFDEHGRPLNNSPDVHELPLGFICFWIAFAYFITLMCIHFFK